MVDILKSKEDVQKLESSLSIYSKQKMDTYLPYLDLVKAYEKLIPHGNHGSRVFYAILDLKFNFISLTVDNFMAGATWNQQSSIKLNADQTILDNPVLFSKRFGVHHFESNYIPRYRAMWDKIMGVYLLIASEEKYKQYNSSKSRKKAFKRLAVDIDFFGDGFVEYVLEHTQKFDDQFRTGEIHRFGSLRKYSFLENPHSKNEYINLKNTFNVMLHILTDLDKIIDGVKKPKP